MPYSSTTAENRAAIASVRGYLYQFAKVIELLLDAKDGDVVSRAFHAIDCSEVEYGASGSR